jgi:hypothetical protein
MERFIWWTAVSLFTYLIIWVLIADLWLAESRSRTITDYLRTRPTAFWVPAVFALAAFVSLTIHLFLFAED